MKKQKKLVMISIIVLLFLTAPTTAISNEEISTCICEDEDNIILVENVGETEYHRLEKYENDLLCMLFSSNRVDTRFRVDVAMCTRDENT